MACLIVVSLYGSYSAFFIYMRRNRKILNRPSVRAKYGVLYDGFFPVGIYGDIKYIEYYSFTFFLRRAAFVGITFALISYPGLQVMAITQMNIFYLIYVGHIDFYL